MIALQDISFREGEIITLSNGVILVGSKPKRSLSDIKIQTESREIEIANFAELSLSLEAGGLPTCEVAIWKGVAFIVGFTAIVVVSEGEILKCDLFRKQNDDCGFYKTEWLDAGHRLFCVYESGILAWNEGGQQLWHISKFWDDVFAGFEGERLVLMIEGGDRIVIDPSNGSQERHPASWREAPHPRG
jgi:hypothetical protein